MRTDWYIFIGAGAFVGLYVYACIFWCLFRYRRREQPQQFTGNTKLELLYTALPILLVLALFGVTFRIENPVDHVAANPATTIAAIAYRWSWHFEYPGRISSFGATAQPPTLYLPQGETTRIELTSTDVTHSFWVPAFLFKRDAIPGMTNAFDITPTRLGRFEGRCAQYCGLDHALMEFTVQVIPAAAYQRFLSSGGRVAP